jgi:transcriptional regulator with XRE-family HTH domain
MKTPIKSTVELGHWIREVRRAQGLRQDDVAMLSGSSHVTLKQIENGAPGVAIGKIFAALHELGIGIELDLPDQYAATTRMPERTHKSRS